MILESNEMPSGSGTTNGFSVEARYMYSEPRQIAGVLLDQRWRTIPFGKGPGVPIGPEYEIAVLCLCGLVSYPSAQALRWWFHAEASRDLGGGLCLETRIVSHKVRYSYGATRISEHSIIGGDDRSSLLPDWGKKEDPAVITRAAE